MSEVYNSQWTGAQIDEAINDVRTNKQTWSDKSTTADKITFSDGKTLQQKVDSGELTGEDGYTPVAGEDYPPMPTTATALPTSGTALTDNTIYHVTNAVGTYAFVPPASGWAHGYFATGSTVSVSFSGTFVGEAPSIEANKAYEFDVFDGIWSVQEVVSA